MAAIDHFNLRSFDLNLLLAFDALMEERSVTRAAARLKIQQPAMSHALASLRHLLGDELFVRAGAIMQPTPRAQSLAIVIRRALEQAQEALLSRDRFDPAREERTFRIGLSAELEARLLPDLVAALRTSAPSLRLLTRRARRGEVHRMLDEDAIDLAIGCFEEAAPFHRRRALFEEKHLTCYNPNLLPLEPPLDEATYLATPHALVSLSESLSGCLEASLAAAGRELNVVAAAPHFLGALEIAAAAPVLATVPARVAERYAKLLGLTTSPLPLALAPFSVAMLWHARTDQDQGASWLRGEVLRAAERRS